MTADISAARLYLVARSDMRAGSLADLVPELAAAGVDLVQLREKEMDDPDLIPRAAAVAEACAGAGIPFILNDRADLALAVGAAGVHLGQEDLPVDIARRILGPAVIGRSTHSEAQIDAEVAAAATADYLAVGPVFETPTKPGRPAVGPQLLSYAAEAVTLPWFAIGGIDGGNLEAVMAAGARRIVVVRAVTEAADPIAAAGRLRASLDAVPLGPRR